MGPWLHHKLCNPIQFRSLNRWLQRNYIDPDYGRDPYWDTEIYYRDLLQFQEN